MSPSQNKSKKSKVIKETSFIACHCCFQGEVKKKRHWSCEQCDEIFHQKQAFDVHVDANHMEIIPKKCYFCPFLKRQRSEVEEHIFTKHSKVPVIEGVNCKYCLKNFTPEYYKVHVQDCDMIPIFRCHLCSYQTKKHQELGEHLVENHMLSCGNCSFRTISQTFLERHTCQPKFYEFLKKP